MGYLVAATLCFIIAIACAVWAFTQERDEQKQWENIFSFPDAPLSIGDVRLAVWVKIGCSHDVYFPEWHAVHCPEIIEYIRTHSTIDIQL